MGYFSIPNNKVIALTSPSFITPSSGGVALGVEGVYTLGLACQLVKVGLKFLAAGQKFQIQLFEEPEQKIRPTFSG